MYEKNKTTESKMSSSKCSCCPYGFHIDRDFVRYCDSLYNSAQLDKLRQHKRERRKEKKSVESYLGLGCLSFEQKKIPNPVIRQNSTPSLHEKSKEFYLQSDDLKNAVNDFEDTWKRSLKKSSGRHDVEDRRNGIKQFDSIISSSGTIFNSSLSSVNSEDIKDIKFSLHASRSSSSSSVSSHSTSHSHVGLLPVSDDSCNSILPSVHTSLSKPLNHAPLQTVGISTSVLTNIRQQMASSLYRMKELEEQVKSIPVLKVQISTLSEEKKSLLNELKVKESMISEVKHSKSENELEKQLKKLENEGIMSPTLSRKCLSYRHQSDSLFSPAIASSLDATMIKKSFIQNKIISHLKIDDSSDSLDTLKSKKSIGTSCAVLTRDIGVGYVPNKFKSIAVGNDFSQNEYINLSRRSHFEKLPSVSSESLESDPDSWSGIGDIPRFSSEYRHKEVLVDKVFIEHNSSKSLVDSSTNTQLNLVDKSVGTVKESLFDEKKASSVGKTVRHKSVSVSPSVINKYIQVSNKCAVKHIGSQTSENKVKDTYKIRSYTHDIGVGDFVISDEKCDNCKKCRKSVGVGDFDINNGICKKCRVNNTLFQSVGIGEFDINISCEKCQIENAVKEKVLAMYSVGTNTTFDLNVSNSNIHICDKCSEAIHSVAHDLAADSSGASSSMINSNIIKEHACKSKLAKLKFDKTLKLQGINSEKSLILAGTKNDKEISRESSRSKNITDEKDDKNLNTDTDSTETSLSSEILPHFTNLPVLPRKKIELNKEIKAACKVLNDHLQKADHSNEKKTLSSLKIIQSEWFKAANQKKADPHLIEDYLDAFEEFSKLLLHKIVNLSDSNGNTALHYAVSYGNFDVVSILIDSKVCDVNLKNKAGYTSIMLVALAEVRNDTHCYVVQRLFSIGDINIKATQNGQTALMLAVSHGKKDIVKILHDVGAEVNLQDKDGSTALMCAAEHGHLELAKLLLAHPECDPTIVDNDGCTALTIAMEAGHKDIGLLIYTNMNFSRGSSPYSTLKSRKRSTPRSTPPPHTPTLRTPPLPSPATKSMNSLTSFNFPI